MKKCEFYLTPDQLGGGANVPDGFHIEAENNRVCPRGLEGDGANPYGKCRFYDVERCSAVMEEELHCPVRRGKMERNIEDLFGDW